MSGLQQLKDRPPYVRFGYQQVEDRAASLEAGSYITKDVPIVFITPQGSKDCIERVVDDWFAQLQRDVAEGRLPREWFAEFKSAFEMWKDGQEIPVNGTPLLTWPVASPAVVRALTAVGCRTVEDLAAANEETISRIGMGARALKQRAVDWLAQAAGPGKVNAELSALRAENANLKVRNEQLETRLAVLEAGAAAGKSSKES